MSRDSIIDFQTDPGLQAVFAHVARPDLPEWVKTASLDEAIDCKNSQAYADLIRNRLPCHTKLACYLSHLYYESTKDSLPTNERTTIEGRLKKHAANYDIEQDVTNIAGWFVTEPKLAEAVITRRLIQNVNAFPIQDIILYARDLTAADKSTPESSKFASDWSFDRQFKNLSYEMADLLRRCGKTEMFDSLYGKTASTPLTITPRQSAAAFPAMASNVAKLLPTFTPSDLKSEFDKFASYEYPVLAVGNQIHLLESEVKKWVNVIDKLANIPLIDTGLPIPRRNWQETFEDPKYAAAIVQFVNHSGCIKEASISRLPNFI